MSGSCCAGNGGMLPVERLTNPRVHLSLNVRDLDASVRFYEAFLGVAAHKRRPGYANFALDRPALKLALNELSPEATGRTCLNHLGIQVETAEEVQAARERFAAAGLQTLDEGDTVCCFARQDKVWVHDPDGNAWEIYVLTDDMLTEGDENIATGALVHFVPEAPTPSTGARPAVCCKG